jgi:hypothetical protein
MIEFYSPLPIPLSYPSVTPTLTPLLLSSLPTPPPRYPTYSRKESIKAYQTVNVYSLGDADNKRNSLKRDPMSSAIANMKKYKVAGTTRHPAHTLHTNTTDMPCLSLHTINSRHMNEISSTSISSTSSSSSSSTHPLPSLLNLVDHIISFSTIYFQYLTTHMISSLISSNSLL